MKKPATNQSKSVIPRNKIPVVLEEFLFLNPDTAIAFNNLEFPEKKQYIAQVKACKDKYQLETLLLEIKQKLESID